MLLVGKPYFETTSLPYGPHSGRTLKSSGNL